MGVLWSAAVEGSEAEGRARDVEVVIRAVVLKLRGSSYAIAVIGMPLEPSAWPCSIACTGVRFRS